MRTSCLFGDAHRSAAILSLCFVGVLCGQTPRRPLVVSRSQYRIVAGERVAVDAPSETLAFMRTAKSWTASALGASNRAFALGPNVAGGQILLGVPLTTRPGAYLVEVSIVNEVGEERAATLEITVEPFASAAAVSAVPPVVLLDGWQLSLTNSCPMSSNSTGTFDNLQSYLLGPPNYVPVVYFFENCTECPKCSIEQLGADLGTFLNSLSVPQVDVVAHSMGGLIVRSYLSGKQSASGVFDPPPTQKIRKAAFLATPHFGSFQADLLFLAGIQTDEMKRDSQFAWDLARWNQFGDDLRGVDAVAVIGNAGPLQQNDGVVGLSSGSLDFASPGRTRIVNYCHIPPSGELGLAGLYLDCEEPGIAYIDSPSHQTYEIISSFLMSTSAWEGIGNAPVQDNYLSKDGGIVFADVSASDQFVGGLAGVSWGSIPLTTGAASGELFYNDLVTGTASFAFGSSTCGPYTATAGVYSTVRCKTAPSVSSVGPLLPGTAKVVEAGTTITISGTGFGAQQCATCQVTAANPQPTALQVQSWGDTAITALLPVSYGIGLVTIDVITASGSDAINIMAGALSTPPVISLSASSLSFAYTVGGTTPPPQTVSVTNAGGGSLAYSVVSNSAWLTASAEGGAITIFVSTSGLAVNTYQGAITVTAAGASNSPQTISVSLVVSATPPAIVIAAIENSATSLVGPIAPGELISIEGSGLGPGVGAVFSVDPATGMVDTTLAGTTVFFGSIAAPITYSSSTQINVITPYEVAGQSQVSIEVQYQGASSTSTTVQVASASPGAYTLNASGTGPVVAVNHDGTLNGSGNPAAKGSYVTVYFTGGGQTNPPGVTGSVTGIVLKWLTQAISVEVGGPPATVTFDGSAPTLVDGVDQLNIQLSPNTPSGAHPIVITIGGVSSPSSGTLAVQ
jgi:uncharacterized protein (TIGR03437 family)